MENIKQALIELLAEFLDSEQVVLIEKISRKNDTIKREESELHIRMAEAAFCEYEKTVQ